MNNTNIVVSLDTRRAKKDGTYPLIFRIGHNERTTSIPVGISLLEKDWDIETRTVKKSYTGTLSVTRLNNLIQKRKTEAMDAILKLHEDDKLQTLSVKDIRHKIDQKSSSGSFYEFAANEIEELVKANRLGTARSYKGVISVLKTFHKGKDLLFREITYNFLVKLETHHRANGNELNGLAVYMRTIRALYNKGIKAGVAEEKRYPFNDYKIKTIPTQKRALDWEFLKKIIDFNIQPDEPYFKVRNYFLSSYMMYGMNFKDMAYLEKKDIVNGRIVYRREKTSKLYDIKITENLKIILDYYIGQNPASKYIFPIIKSDNLIAQDKEITEARKRYNKKLKSLAEKCGIEMKLTSYVSRHSFATQAMVSDIPVTAISTMLGHSSLKTTQIYLKALPSNILDDYNSKILQGRNSNMTEKE